MIEIIKEGEQPSEKQYEAKCYKCGTVCCFDKSDINIETIQEYGDLYPRTSRFIFCPVCSKRIPNCDFKNIEHRTKRKEDNNEKTLVSEK